MDLSTVEGLVRRLGGVIAYVTLALILVGIWQGMRHRMGRAVGRTSGWLRSTGFFFFATALFLAFAVYFWKPLPLTLSPTARGTALALGGILFLFGMAFVLWGRLTLGKMYFVSTGSGAQLFADHQLVTNGPFAIVRHPMYLGLIAAALGGFLFYRTWTMAYFALGSPALLMRARREEQALAAEFGQAWHEYCRRVSAFVPFGRRK